MEQRETLDEIIKIAKDLEEQIDDPETFLDTLESIDWQDRLEEKLESYARVHFDMLSRIEAIKMEEQRLAKKRKAIESNDERLVDRVQGAFKAAGLTKVEAGAYTLRVSKSKRVEVDEVLLPSKYFIEKVERKPDKKNIRKLLSEGQEISGAQLVEVEGFKIK